MTTDTAIAHLRAVLPYAESRAEDMEESDNHDVAKDYVSAETIKAIAAVDAAKAFLAGTPSDAPADPVKAEMLAVLIDLLTPGRTNGHVIETGRDLLARLGHDVRGPAAAWGADPIKAEMLAALKAVKARTDFDDGHDLAPSVVDAVNAAIARAEGKA